MKTSGYRLLGGRGKKAKKTTNSNPRPRKNPSPFANKRSKLGSGALSFLAWIVALVLGIFALVGCVSPQDYMQKLYIAELSANKTYDIQLRVGYFGGCVSITNTTGGPSISADGSSSTTQSQCISNMRGHDIEDVSEELWEDLKLTDAAQTELKNSLNETLPVARHLQEDVFPWYAPVFHLFFFVLSGVMLFALSTNKSVKRSYKLMLVIAVLMGGFALALTYLTTIGSLYALNGLLDGDESKESQVMGGLVIHRAHRLYHIQLAQIGLTTLFYIVIGGMYLQE